MTHTLARLPVSAATYDEVHAALAKAGYFHVLSERGSIDMSGIALERIEPSPAIDPLRDSADEIVGKYAERGR